MENWKGDLHLLKTFSSSKPHEQAQQDEEQQKHEQADIAQVSSQTFRDGALAVKVGSYITFGTYPQTADGTDKTPIEWLVLDRDGDKALLISRYGLDAQPYNTEWTDITWEKCTLRTWLNRTFMNEAFTWNEENSIVLTDVDNSQSRGYSELDTWDIDGDENNTHDKIFLLSYTEANKYFGVASSYGNSNNTIARVEPTAYAIAQGADILSGDTTASGKEAGSWWLRSPGYFQCYAACVYSDGSLFGSYVCYASYCVRPAIWVDLTSEIFQSAN